MDTQNVSAEMTLALQFMARFGARTPSLTGIGIRTFRALERRGLAQTKDGREFELTDDARVYLFDKV